MEIVCKLGPILLNYSKELSALYSVHKKQKDIILDTSVWSFVKIKYNLEMAENLSLFSNWVQRMWNPSDIEVQTFSDLEAIKGSQMGILYLMPSVTGNELSNEVHNINFLRNSFMGIPLLWARHGHVLHQVEVTENQEKPYVGTFLNHMLVYPYPYPYYIINHHIILHYVIINYVINHDNINNLFIPLQI